jgi:hypothetical protein
MEESVHDKFSLTPYMPPFVRRRYWLVVAITCASALIAFSLMLLTQFRAFRLAGSFLLFGFIIAHLTITLWFSRWVKRIITNAIAKDYLVCWSCGYGLQELADQHKCPECGEAFTQKELKHLWHICAIRYRIKLPK